MSKFRENCVTDARTHRRTTSNPQDASGSAAGPINSRPKFLYTKQRSLSADIRRLPCITLILPHFYFACPACLNKKFKKKIQVAQNKCIRFCLSLGDRSHIGARELETTNWLPTKDRYHSHTLTLSPSDCLEQCLCVCVNFQFLCSISNVIHI